MTIIFIVQAVKTAHSCFRNDIDNLKTLYLNFSLCFTAVDFVRCVNAVIRALVQNAVDQRTSSYVGSDLCYKGLDAISLLFFKNTADPPFLFYFYFLFSMWVWTLSLQALMSEKH